jgi:membrane protein implicated in regulation of membrane protease activity
VLRRLEILIVGAVLLVGAFATGADFLFFLVYLVLLVVGGAYLLSRFGLADLEAGYALDRTHGHVGE